MTTPKDPINKTTYLSHASPNAIIIGIIFFAITFMVLPLCIMLGALIFLVLGN